MTALSERISQLQLEAEDARAAAARSAAEERRLRVPSPAALQVAPFPEKDHFPGVGSAP